MVLSPLASLHEIFGFIQVRKSCMLDVEEQHIGVKCAEMGLSGAAAGFAEYIFSPPSMPALAEFSVAQAGQSFPSAGYFPLCHEH